MIQMTERSGQAAARVKERSQGQAVRRGRHGAEQLLPVDQAGKGEKRFGGKIRLCCGEHEDRSAQTVPPIFHGGFAWIDLIDRRDRNGNVVRLSFQCSRSYAFTRYCTTGNSGP